MFLQFLNMLIVLTVCILISFSAVNFAAVYFNSASYLLTRWKLTPHPALLHADLSSCLLVPLADSRTTSPTETKHSILLFKSRRKLCYSRW